MRMRAMLEIFDMVMEHLVGEDLQQSRGPDAIGADAILHVGADLAFEVDQKPGHPLNRAEDHEDRNDRG